MSWGRVKTRIKSATSILLLAMLLVGMEFTGSASSNTDTNDNIVDGVIAIYGTEREFDTEDERQNWLVEVDKVGSRMSVDLQEYMYPDGSVIMYGYGSDGLFVSFLEGSEVNESLMNEIYDKIDQRAVQNGIEDIPVEFEFESIPKEDIETVPVPDEGPAEDIETLNALGFTTVSLVMALLFVLKREQK